MQHGRERPIRWHCAGCEVWGRDMQPAACWSCGTSAVEHEYGPPLGDAYRSYEALDETSELRATTTGGPVALTTRRTSDRQP
jgi:hypothetical protein